MEWGTGEQVNVEGVRWLGRQEVKRTGVDAGQDSQWMIAEQEESEKNWINCNINILTNSISSSYPEFTVRETPPPLWGSI